MSEYGYCRISTKQQNISRQRRNILYSYPNAEIIEEVYSGTTQDRPEWKKLLTKIQSGDTIIFDSVSRMSRDAESGFNTYQSLFQQDITLVFLKEPHINTETYRSALSTTISMTGSSVDLILDGVNKYLMQLAKEQIRIAFDQAQKEVEDLHQRTREGIQTARMNGKQIGRRPGAVIITKKEISSKQLMQEYNKSFGGPLNDRETYTKIGISRNTFYKYKRELIDKFRE